MTAFQLLRLSFVFALLAGCGGTAGSGVGTGADLDTERSGDGARAEGAAHDEALPEELRLSPAALARLDLKVAPAAEGRLEGRITALATLVPQPRREAEVAALAPGRLVELRAVEGDRVSRGAVLAMVRSVELGEARAAALEARARLDAARAARDRTARLHQEGVASDRQLQEAEAALAAAASAFSAAEARLRAYGVEGGQGPDYPLRSPIDGVVVERHAVVGGAVDASEAIFRIADRAVLWAVGEVPEHDARHVRVGVPALLTVDAWPGRSWQGSVEWVSEHLDPDTRTLEVRATVDNADGALRPGMYGALLLAPDDSGPDLALIPVDAVQRIDGQDVVFVPGRAEGVFRVRSVALGTEAGGLVEVIEGLEPGEPVVVGGAFDLMSAATASSRDADHHD